MNHLRKFETLGKFDLEIAMSKIGKKFSDRDVASRFDDEWPNWVDDNWEDEGYDSDYEWYCDHNNGEAQEVVIEEIISWYVNSDKIELTDSERSDLFQEIKHTYQLI